VDHIGDGAHPVHGVEHINGLGGVGHTDCNAVTLAGSKRFERGGYFVDAFYHE
jgi:hypothetical protein